jgi:hypothetical protein
MASGSTAANPDLDWSQLKETIVMLNLAIAQIRQSLHEGTTSVDTLAHSFTALATNLSDIQESIAHIDTSDHPENEKVKTIIQGSAATASDKVQAAIIAFQFYDKLTQRLDHVGMSLSSLTELISDPASLYSPPQWVTLQQKIRDKYTMEEERRMFDQVLSGVAIDDALKTFNQEISHGNKDDDVELF